MPSESPGGDLDDAVLWLSRVDSWLSCLSRKMGVRLPCFIASQHLRRLNSDSIVERRPKASQDPGILPSIAFASLPNAGEVPRPGDDRPCGRTPRTFIRLGRTGEHTKVRPPEMTAQPTGSAWFVSCYGVA